MNKIVQFAKTYKSYIFLGLIILLALKVFIPQLDQLKESIQTLKDADPFWVWLAIIVFFCGLPILAWQYMALAFKKLKFGLTLRVQMAGLFVSKLLPSSLGTITLNMYYFTKKNHSVAEATTVMTMNGITSGIAYLGLLIIAFASSDFTLSTILDEVSIPKKAIFIILAILCILAFIVVKSGNIKQKISNGWQGLLDNLGTYKKTATGYFYRYIDQRLRVIHESICPVRISSCPRSRFKPSGSAFGLHLWQYSRRASANPRRARGSRGWYICRFSNCRYQRPRCRIYNHAL